jgi:hypothetical protein
MFDFVKIRLHQLISIFFTLFTPKMQNISHCNAFWTVTWFWLNKCWIIYFLSVDTFWNIYRFLRFVSVPQRICFKPWSRPRIIRRLFILGIHIRFINFFCQDLKKRGYCFCFLMYLFQHCFICQPPDFFVSENAGIETRTDCCNFAIASQTL